MIVLVDNYDSFTWNLVQALWTLGARARVIKNDELTVEEVCALRPRGVVISPGPCSPREAGISVPLIQCLAKDVPILGVCLGHQAIGAAFGGVVVRAPLPMHGKVSLIEHQGEGVFAGLPEPLSATRYHSLIVEAASLPKTLRVTARTADGLIMGLEALDRPVFGVQFHPESILTPDGPRLLENFMKRCGP